MVCVKKIFLSYVVRSLHDTHSDFPLLPIKRTVDYEELSEYQREVLQKHGIKYRKTVKLLSDLNDKKGYICHYLNLKLALELGLVCTDVIEAIRFEQKPIFKVKMTLLIIITQGSIVVYIFSLSGLHYVYDESEE